MGMSETLKAISDPVRRDILEMLKAIKLIDYEITYYKQVGKPPIPMHTLKVARGI